MEKGDLLVFQGRGFKQGGGSEFVGSRFCKCPI